MNSVSLPKISLLHRRLTHLLICVALALLLPGCESEPKAKGPKPPATVGRSVLVYMIANNSLGVGSEGNDKKDLEEMKQAAREGSLGANRLIVYWHPYRQNPSLVEVTADELVTLKEYDTEQTSVSAARMLGVIDDFHSVAPARHYGLVLWSHGSGWLQDGIAEIVPPQSSKKRAFGEDNGRMMNVTTLAGVLNQHDFDYVYFDCCHMAGVEVAYELRHATDCIVGSVAELPGEGMPYHLTLPFLMADEADLNAAAGATFSYFFDKTSYEQTCTMSVIDSSRLDALGDAVKQLYSALPSASYGSYRPQQFVYRSCPFFDLADYLEALVAAHPECTHQLGNALQAIDDAVTYRNATPYIWKGYYNQVEIKHHCGLSTLIREENPGAFINKNYTDLQWWTDVASHLYD